MIIAKKSVKYRSSEKEFGWSVNKLPVCMELITIYIVGNRNKTIVKIYIMNINTANAFCLLHTPTVF